MVRTFQTRRAFIEHALVFLRVHDFDGIDLGNVPYYGFHSFQKSLF